MDRPVKVKITKLRRRTLKVEAPLLRSTCAVCKCEVEMLTNESAAEILKTDDQGLDRLIAEGQVHTIQTVNGNTWVCKDSLFLG